MSGGYNAAMRLVLTHEGAVYAYEVRKETTTVGRDPACDIALPTGTVSRFHAQLKREGDDLVLRDLGSRNGTFVNGARVKEVTLRAGDEIRLGKIALRFEADAAPGVPKGFTPQGPAPAPGAAPPPAAGGDNPTPVDLAFSPQESAGAAGGPSDGPPRDAPRQAAGRGFDLRLFLGRHWKAAAAAFVTVDVLAIALYMAARDGKPPPPETRPAAPALVLEEIALAMEEARDLLSRDPAAARRIWADCRARLAALRGAHGDRVATRLLILLDWWEPVEPDYGNFPWAEYRRIAETLSEIELDRKAPLRVQEIARAWGEWLSREVLARQALRDLEPLLSPQAGLARWREAHAALQKADRTSLAWPAYEKRLPELERWIREHHLDRAERNLAQGQWDEALAALQEARSWGADPRADALQAELEREQDAQRHLAEAREALAAGRDAEAARLAARVPETSRFVQTRQAIEEELARRQARRETLEAFAAGDAEAALARLARGPYADEALADLMRKTDAAWRAALAAEAALDFDAAIVKSGEVLALLADDAHARNAYRVQAEALRARWEPPAARAQRFFEEGQRLEVAGKVPEAYVWWRKAQATDPDGRWAARDIENYKRQARDLLNGALARKAQGEIAAARRLLTEALAIAETGSYEERRVRELLAELPRE